MKLMFLVITTLTVASNADVLFTAPEKPVKVPAQVPAPNVHPKQAKPLAGPLSGNVSRSWSMIGEGPTTIVNAGATELNADLRVGSLIEVHIPMSVMAFTDGKAPVVGDFSVKDIDYRVLGEATVEKNSKRISIEFKKLRRLGTTDVFDFKAQALDHDGTCGLEGEIHSGKAKFFLAELLSAAAAAFADASVNRNVNALGNQYEENSLDTSSKKALSGTLSKSGEHFAEEMKQNQEYVTVDGPLEVRMLILEAPKRKL